MKKKFTYLLSFIILIYLTCSFSLSKSVTNNVALDHIFIWTDNHLKYKDQFSELGFKPRSTTHYGQGTSSSSIFFENFYLEFISITDSNEFKLNNDKFNLKWKKTKTKPSYKFTSPFGLGLHFTNDTNVAPFTAFDYNQSWMRENTFLKIANSTNEFLNEPYIFIVPDYMKWSFNEFEKIKQKLIKIYLENNLGLEKLTRLEINCPSCDSLSKTAEIIQQIDSIHFTKAQDHHITITFDKEKQKDSIDFRPELPLVFKY